MHLVFYLFMSNNWAVEDFNQQAENVSNGDLFINILILLSVLVALNLIFFFYYFLFKKRKSNVIDDTLLLRAIIEESKTGIVLLNKSGKVIQANKIYCQLLGYKEGELKQKKFADFTHLEDAKKDTELFKKLVDGSIDSYQIEKRYISKNGNIIWGILSVSPVCNERGELDYVVGIIQDISKRKELESGLKEFESIIKISKDISGVIPWVYDVENDDLSYGDEFLDLLEISDKQEKLAIFIEGSDSPISFTELVGISEENMIAGNTWQNEFTLKTPSGRVKYILNVVAKVILNEEGEAVKLIGTSQDVSEFRIKEREAEIRASEFEKMYNLLAEVQKIAKIGFWEVDYINNTLNWSDEVYRIHELELGSKIEVKDGINFFKEDFRELILQEIQYSYKSKQPWDINGIIVTQTGKEVWVRSMGKGIFKEGELVGALGLVIDIDEKMRQNAELSNINKQLELSVKAGNIVTWDLDVNTRKIEWNNQVENFFGIEKDKFAPTLNDFYNIVHPEDFFHVKYDIQKAMNQGTRLEVNFRYKHPSDKLIYVRGSGNGVYDENGELERMIGVIVDVTDQIKIIEHQSIQEAQLRSFVTQAPIAAAMFDLEMNQLTASNEWYHTDIDSNEYQSFELIANRLQKREDWSAIYKKAIDGEVQTTLKDKLIDDNGTTLWINWKVLPWYNADGSIAGLIMYLADVTKEVEYTYRLEKEVEERTEKMIAQTKALEESNKELEAFSFTVSHDLRAPLRTINSFTDILIEEHAEQLNDEGKRIANIVKNESIVMRGLIDDLLEFSRLGGKAIELSNIDMNLLFNSIYKEQVRSLGLKNKQIEFNASDLCNAKGDITLIHQVVENLLSNSLKYSINNDLMKIDVESKVEDGFCIYSIKDNGVGFNMEHYDKLFDVFQRLHSKNEFEGTGVGLAIVKRIVNKHGGDVWAEGNLGKGATFYFSLPN